MENRASSTAKPTDSRAALLAAAATRRITPPEGIELAGYPHFPRHNTGEHDPLLATCLALRSFDGSGRRTDLCLVSLDLLFFSKTYVAEVRHRVSERCAIDGKAVQIFCTHTHSGPWASGRLDIEAIRARRSVDEAYTASLLDDVTDVVCDAVSRLEPAEIGWGVGRCGADRGVGGNRHDPAGPADPLVGVLAMRKPAGDLTACLVNYSLHPTLLHADNTLVSADYPGYLRLAVQERHPGAAVGFAQGTAGDQSTRYFRRGQSFAEAERIGREIAAEVLRVIAALDWQDAAPIRLASAEWPLRQRVFPSRQEAQRGVEQAKADYDRLVASGAPYIDVQNANVFLLGQEDRLGYIIALEDGLPIELRERELPAELTAAAVGGLRLALMPGEVFVAYGLELKKRVARPLLVIELANGCLPGYVYTPEAESRNDYEANTSMLANDAGDKAVDELERLLRGLDQDGTTA